MKASAKLLNVNVYT